MSECREPLLVELENMGCDSKGGLRRFVNNEKMYVKYLHGFPHEKTFTKFKEAFYRKAYEEAAIEMHTFKGIVGNLGFTDLYDLAQKIMVLLKEKDYEQATLCTERLCAKHGELIGVLEKSGR
ncbi:MAG: Hpt domain-containing protein [Anaerovorax sp.]